MSKEIKLPKIEKGIPITRNSRENGMADLLKKMDTGDSFVIDIPAGGCGNFHTYARFAGVKIATRTQPGKKQVRVWRMA